MCILKNRLLGRWSFFIVSFLALSSFALSHPQKAIASEEEPILTQKSSCEKSNPAEGVELATCLRLPAQESRKPHVLIVFLHGLGGDEHTWGMFPKLNQMETMFRKKGWNPAVLSVSFGRFWLLKETPSRTGKPAFFPYFDAALAKAQSQLPLGTPKVVVGVSLGGFNGMQLYFKRPSDYRAFALLGPALVDASPFGFETKREIIADYRTRSHASVISATALVEVTSREFIDPEDYAAHDPLALVQQKSSEELSRLPPLLIQVGVEDHFGFQLGSGIFQHFAKARGLPLEFRMLPGGRGLDHVEMEPSEVVSFFDRVLRR
jgi:pimeloyl-ACP methyl ester carboxylesterase